MRLSPILFILFILSISGIGITHAAAPVSVLVDPTTYVLIRPTATQLANANNLGGGGGGGSYIFTASDFNESGSTISLDFTNGQKATSLIPGFLSAADWVTFNAKAPTASPTLTGTPLAPTAAADTNTTQIATTGFVIGQGYLKSSTAASTYQGLDSDLTSIAALATTSFGRGLLTETSASTLRTTLSLIPGTDVQAYDGDLNIYAGITPGENVQTFLGAADYSAMRTQLSLVPGVNVLAYPSGTPTGFKFARDDNTWQLIPGGDALTANPLSQFAATTSAQLAGVISDEVGTGAVVLNVDAILLSPNSAMGALAVDVAKKRNTKTISADSTLTFSATPSAGTIFGLRLTNSDTAVHTITIPSSFSYWRGTITSFVIPASSTVELSWDYNGTTYYIAGDPVTFNDLTTATPVAGDLVPFYDVSGAVDGKATIANLVAPQIGVTLQAWDAQLDAWSSVTPGTGVATALTATANASGGIVTPDGTKTLTNTTLDASATGNVLKQYGYLILTHPTVFGSGVTQQTTVTSPLYGQALFSNSADKATNYVEYILTVPDDIDTAVDLTGKFKFILGGADTNDHEYEISMIDVAGSAVYDTALADAVSLTYTADGSGADKDVQTAGAPDTLTGWAAALAAGNYWRIRVARDGDNANDGSTVNSYSGPLIIRYGTTQ